MYFTENRYDRSIEWMMKGVPNFYARSSGIVVTGKFEYTAEMCDCRLCEHYGGKLRGCKVPRCVCLEERIAVGVASLKEVMKETMSEIKHSGFNRRLRKYIKESEVIPILSFRITDDKGVSGSMIISCVTGSSGGVCRCTSAESASESIS